MRKIYVTRAIAFLLAFILTGCSASNAAPEGSDPQVQPSQEVFSSHATESTLSESASPDLESSTEPIEEEWNSAQKNAIAMLNYLALVSEEIRISSNERLVLEDIYTSLLNEINPGSIDELTQDHMNDMRYNIKGFLNIDAKRAQLQYMYNQEKASALREAIPNPLSVMSIPNTTDWKRIAANIAYTAIDSYGNYMNHVDSIEQNYMLSGWELDEEERNYILRCRDAAFNYMTDIVQDYGTDDDKSKLGKLTLNERAIEDFAQICALTEVETKIERLTYAEETYKLFGNYWLELADCYYETGEYKKMLDCIDRYNALDINIFRQDFNIVPLLPKAIVAAQNVCPGGEYVHHAKIFADTILENSHSDEWDVRYFAAQTYLDLYAQTNNRDYLTTAYSVIKHNVTELVDDQIELNEKYLNEIQPIELDEKEARRLSPDEKEAEENRIKKYNGALQKRRETELPPLYEPLVLNCELLFSLAGELQIDQAETAKLMNILQVDTNGVFLSDPINEKYTFGNTKAECIISLTEDEVIIPANMLVAGATLRVTVVDSSTTTLYEDFKVEFVERTGETVDSFRAHFASEKMEDHKWSGDAKVTIEIVNQNYCESIVVNFEVAEYSDNWIFSDTVEFKIA